MPDFEEFSPEDFNPEDFSPQSSRERVRLSFKDFLVARGLAGSLSGVPHGGLVPAEFIVDDGTKIEIITSPATDSAHEHGDEAPQEPTVIIKRLPNNEIDTIEFSCSCGQKVVVSINYDDDKPINE